MKSAKAKVNGEEHIRSVGIKILRTGISRKENVGKKQKYIKKEKAKEK